MTELFNIKDGKIVITPDKLAIPVFKQIYERDKSKNKDIAFKELSYIFFMVDFNSPYQSYPNDKKEKMIIEDIFKDKWSPDKLVKEGITKYTEFTDTAVIRLVRSAQNACDKLADYFNNVDYTLKDDNDKLVYTAKDVVLNLKNIGDISDSLSKLEEKIKKDIKQTSKVRGGGEPGMYEA
jgi:hypothetical protein